MTRSFSSLKCPVCEASLTINGRTLRCDDGHTFDQAKQGYFNLLLNQDKASKSPGDTAEMVLARSTFLESGHYAPLVNACSTLVCQYVSDNTRLDYTDIASGEAYYTQQFDQALTTKGLTPNTTAIDISTPAIKKAARRLPQGICLVGNAFRLPIKTDSQQLTTHMFCRPCPPETARILRDDGILIDVAAGPQHLIELREHIYEQVTNKEEATQPYRDYFETIEHLALSFQITINQREIAALVGMTPHIWRANTQRIDDVKSLPSIQLTCDFVITVLKPVGTRPIINAALNKNP